MKVAEFISNNYWIAAYFLFGKINITDFLLKEMVIQYRLVTDTTQNKRAFLQVQ